MHPSPAHATPERGTRPPAFDALGEPVDRRSRHPWLPFAALAAIVLLMAALFLAMLAEDRQLQREALRRDFDSAAQQLSARLTSLSEAVSAAALEVGAQALDERRFASFANDLAAAKPEVQRIKFVSADGRLVWEPAPAGPVPMLPDDAVDAGFLPLLTEARQAPDVLWRVLHSDSRPPELALVVPVYAGGAYAGALLVRVSPNTLLRSLSAETLDRYRLQLLADGAVLAATSASEPPPRAATYMAPLAPLPPSITLLASAFRTPSPLTGTAPVWLVGALTVAVVIALFALLRYTTRLVRADRALLAETSLRRAMENSLATGLRVLDRDGVTRYVNRAFCEMTGWKEADLLGRGPPFPYWPPERIEEQQAKLSQILAGATDKDGFEAVVVRPDGSRFDARMYVSPLVDEGGAQIGWVTSMTDITEQKRNRDALAAAHDRFTTVLESLQAAVSVVAIGTQHGHELLFANRAYQQEFAQDADGHHRLAAELGGGEADRAGEVQDRSTGRWYDVRMRALRWVDGRPAILQVASDITLRKTTEEIVRQQQDKVQFTSRLMTMGEMASSLAHELNQPLTAIANYSEGALARLATGQARTEDLRPALEKVSAQAQRAGRIIRRIREFVKRSEPRRRPTEAARIIDDAVAFAEIEARKKGIAIEVTVAPGLPPLDVDPILIEQVLLNLLKNAIDAMDHALVRRIDVVASAAGGMAQIEVIDRGSGIPEAHVGSLFEPFFSTKSEGMGMGLNICRSIVEFHHGRLQVAPNPEPVGGTIMRFTLPLAAKPLDPENAGAISEVGAMAANEPDRTER